MRGKVILASDRIWNEAVIMDEGLERDDPRFQHCVMLQMEDGSQMYLAHSFLVSWNEYWLFVFRARHPCMVFYKDEIRSYQELEMV